MVDRGGSGKCVGKHRSSASSKISSCSSSEFDQEYREHLEGKYLGSGVEVRPASGTNHQQPGSHLSIDTRLSELSLGCHDRVIDAGNDGLSSQSQSASSKNTSKVNCYITSPFKQGYNVPKSEPHKPIIDPSIELKRVTKDSIARVRQQFRKPKPPPPPSLYGQRLRKAKIKSTGRPISGSGPSIQQCKGVQAGRRVVNRTAAPLVYFKDDRPLTGSSFTRPERPTEMHRPDSSIHCTSRASSIEDKNSFLDECFDNDPVCDSRDNVPVCDSRDNALDTVDQHPSCDHAGTCKPFSDAKYHSHDDDDDDITHSKALLSNYNGYCYNHNVTSQDSNEFKAYSGTGKSKTKMGNQASMLTDDCVHVVDSGDDTPVLTVRTKLDSTAAAPWCDSIDTTPNNICESYDKIDFEKDDGSIQMKSDSNDDCNDDDDLDTDRIPSAVIWNNLDQLNLSMNASSSQYKDNLNSNARQVQSAGHCRDTSTVYSVINGEKFERNKQRSRTSSSKSRKIKKNSAKPHEDIGKVELLCKYLSEESQKFCADLPGYFTEQFHIIQEAKKTLTGVLECQQDVSTALVKYEGEEDTTSDAIKSNETDLQEIDDNSTSFGVFFTVDSTSTCDVDSMSVSSHDSIPTFSDDTRFETIPSVDISQHGQNTTQHADQVRFVKPEDLEVVAKAKLLTGPKLSNAQYANNCPHEPLKFSLNARAPPGYMFYFAYGVDMNTKRMSLYLRREHKRLWGVLFGFKLRFNKKDIVVMATLVIVLFGAAASGASVSGPSLKTMSAYNIKIRSLALMKFIRTTRTAFAKERFNNGNYDHHVPLPGIDPTVDYAALSNEEFLKRNILLLANLYHMLTDIIDYQTKNPATRNFTSRFQDIKNQVNDIVALLHQLERISGLPVTSTNPSLYVKPTINPQATQKDHDEWALMTLKELFLSLITLKNGTVEKFEK